MRPGWLAIRAGGHGTTEEVPLGLVAFEVLEKRQLLGLFHALGHDPQVQAARHADHGRDDRRVVTARTDLSNEGLVDLQGIDGETPQVAQARIAGPKVIDGDPDAALAQRLEDLRGRRDVLHEHALGQLQLEHGRIEAGLRQDPVCRSTARTFISGVKKR
jgi:hypothetical protein